MHDAAEIRQHGRAKLVRSENPPVNGADISPAEQVGTERDRWWNGRDVVESEHDREERQTRETQIGQQRQKEEGNRPKRIKEGQQFSGIVSVSQPT